MKKPNYGFEKHKKEMKRKREQEEKMRRKLNNANKPDLNAPTAPSEAPSAPGPAPETAQTPAQGIDPYQVTDSGETPK